MATTMIAMAGPTRIFANAHATPDNLAYVGLVQLDVVEVAIAAQQIDVQHKRDVMASTTTATAMSMSTTKVKPAEQTGVGSAVADERHAQTGESCVLPHASLPAKAVTVQMMIAMGESMKK